MSIDTIYIISKKDLQNTNKLFYLKELESTTYRYYSLYFERKNIENIKKYLKSNKAIIFAKYKNKILINKPCKKTKKCTFCVTPQTIYFNYRGKNAVALEDILRIRKTIIGWSKDPEFRGTFYKLNVFQSCGGGITVAVNGYSPEFVTTFYRLLKKIKVSKSPDKLTHWDLSASPFIGKETHQIKAVINALQHCFGHIPTNCSKKDL